MNSQIFDLERGSGSIKVTFFNPREERFFHRINESKLFQNWLASVETQFHIVQLEIQSADFFGPRLAFLKVKALIKETEGQIYERVSFLRGGSVGIMMMLECEGLEYLVMVAQPRFSIGQRDMLEIPAGMLDDNGDVVGVAIKEIEEETGLKIRREQLIDLNKLAFGHNFPHIFMTCGASDEFILLYYFRQSVPKALIENLMGKKTGNPEENEDITVRLIPYNPDTLLTLTPDAKSLIAFAWFQKFRQENLL